MHEKMELIGTDNNRAAPKRLGGLDLAVDLVVRRKLCGLRPTYGRQVLNAGLEQCTAPDDTSLAA